MSEYDSTENYVSIHNMESAEFEIYKGLSPMLFKIIKDDIIKEAGQKNLQRREIKKKSGCMVQNFGMKTEREGEIKTSLI